MHVAEMDVHLAAPIQHALERAIRSSDTGYAGDPSPLVNAFADFARRRWGWEPERRLVRTCADVATGVTEVLRLLLKPGDRVVSMPPVYPPFGAWLSEVGAVNEAVPLREHPGRDGLMDLEGVAAALAGGARAVLLCHPHNPTGTVHTRAELRTLAELARAHGAAVLSDEIHAPLAHAGIEYTPFLSASSEAQEVGLAFHSASKAWNLAGLKAALVVGGQGAWQQDLLTRLPHEMPWTTGHFGVLASVAAYDEGDEWLDDLKDAIGANIRLVKELLDRHVSKIKWEVPAAGYLAWLDCRDSGLGPDPARRVLETSRLATSSGPDFGPPGLGHLRMNIACHPSLLRDAIERLASACSTE